MLTIEHAKLPASGRLRADVALYSTGDGHVLRVGDLQHDVHLDAASAAELIAALRTSAEPAGDRARGALAALRDAGLVDPAPRRIGVAGNGALAAAVRSALGRMGVAVDADRDEVTVFDNDLPSDLPDGAAACWVAGSHVILTPVEVAASDVRARYRAAHTQMNFPAPEPADAGVRSARPFLSGAGLELAAVQVAVELLRVDRAPYEALLVDLVTLTSSRHVVLPVPPAPR